MSSDNDSNIRKHNTGTKTRVHAESRDRVTSHVSKRARPRPFRPACARTRPACSTHPPSSEARRWPRGPPRVAAAPRRAHPKPPLPPPLPVRPNPPRRPCTAAAHCGHAARGENRVTQETRTPASASTPAAVWRGGRCGDPVSAMIIRVALTAATLSRNKIHHTTCMSMVQSLPRTARHAP